MFLSRLTAGIVSACALFAIVVIRSVSPAFSTRMTSNSFELDLDFLLDTKSWNDQRSIASTFDARNESSTNNTSSSIPAGISGQTEQPQVRTPKVVADVTSPRMQNATTGKAVGVFPKLDAAIVGFPKCGTTALLAYLRSHSNMQWPQREQCGLCDGKEKDTLGVLREELKTGDYVYGIKCPRLLESPEAIHKLSHIFPGVRIIVGVRHPVLWFESFYNFRLRKKFDLLPPNKLIGDCPKIGPPRKTGNSCTGRAKFHEYLARLGKTNLSNTAEQQFFDGDLAGDDIVPKGPEREIFLYEVSQMNDTDEPRRARFREDLSSFLNLDPPLGPLPTGVMPNSRQMEVMLNNTGGTRQIDICDKEHDPVRTVLMQIAVDASRWIRKYFIHANGVTVSSTQNFVQLLEKWEEDPCTS